MANRFWVTQPVSGAIVSVASAPQIRLTVASTTGMTTGDVRTVFGVGGTTEANGTWTITVIDGTHIDLQGTTFANVYTSGGSVNGKWDATNTNNWVTTSGNTNYGQTVPGSSDAAVFDGSSGGGTVVVNANLALQSITNGAHTGTLTFAANNNNVTLSAALNGSGSGTRSFDMGNGTWTFTGTGNVIVFSTVTGLTPTFGNAAIVLSGNTSSLRTILPGGLTFGSLTIGSNSSKGIIEINALCGFSSITIGDGNTVGGPAAATVTVSGAITGNGTPNNFVGLITGRIANGSATFSVGSASVLTNAAVVGVTKAGAGSITANNSMDLGQNSGITFTLPGLRPSFALGM